MPPPPRQRGGQHRHVDPDAPLADQVDAAADLALDAERSQDIAAGLVPVWASRGLHPHELAAHVSFAAIDRNEQGTGANIARRLADDRRAFTALLVADLERRVTGRAVVDRLLELQVAGLAQVDGAAALLNSTAADVGAALRQHAEIAGALAAAEAGAQGVPIGPFALDADAAGQLEQLAHRLAVAPHIDLVRALRDEAVRLPTPPDAGSLVNVLSSTASSLSEAPLEQAGRNAASMADGLGRQAAAASAPLDPIAIYASELLDGNTCGPCSLVDGTNYPSLAAARLDYPVGIYVRCDGRDRCRGTLVFVWATEAPPTVAK